MRNETQIPEYNTNRFADKANLAQSLLRKHADSALNNVDDVDEVFRVRNRGIYIRCILYKYII